mmetsp:Transcript_10232/g.28583  ORF Transcript_10232/g.28583 Transcript_10232/m.28583 type:complete len:308 (-) Transcript_10232:70-993(-)
MHCRKRLGSRAVVAASSFAFASIFLPSLATRLTARCKVVASMPAARLSSSIELTSAMSPRAQASSIFARSSALRCIWAKSCVASASWWSSSPADLPLSMAALRDHKSHFATACAKFFCAADFWSRLTIRAKARFRVSMLTPALLACSMADRKTEGSPAAMASFSLVSTKPLHSLSASFADRTCFAQMITSSGTPTSLASSSVDCKPRMSRASIATSSARLTTAVRSNSFMVALAMRSSLSSTPPAWASANTCCNGARSRLVTAERNLSRTPAFCSSFANNEHASENRQRSTRSPLTASTADRNSSTS